MTTYTLKTTLTGMTLTGNITDYSQDPSTRREPRIHAPVSPTTLDDLIRRYDALSAQLDNFRTKRRNGDRSTDTQRSLLHLRHRLDALADVIDAEEMKQ